MSPTRVVTVTITNVTEHSVTINGISTSKSNFINAKVGQVWEITVTNVNRYSFGEIVNTKLIKDVEE